MDEFQKELIELKGMFEEEAQALEEQPEEVDVSSESVEVKETRRGWRPELVTKVEDLMSQKNGEKEFLSHASPDKKFRYLSEKAKASRSLNDWAQVLIAGGNI